MRKSLVLFGVLLLSAAAQAADRWQIQFFHDKADSALTINDLKFASANRGVAVGFLTENRKTKPVALVTSDGGQNWEFVKVKRVGVSLFFLNESVGWMVTEKGIWKTEESGRNWKKIRRNPKNVFRVYFRDENHGWAVGAEKGIYETSDGGAHWRPIAALDQVKTTPDNTFFTWITFANEKTGLIAGATNPPRQRASLFPDWMDPERAERQREWPALSILLETNDGGKTWKPSTTSMFGRITRVDLAPDGTGLGLIEFYRSFEWPSEVFGIDWRTGKSTRVFRRKDRVVTDVALTSRGAAYLAAFEPVGKLFRSPVPGKLRILKSEDLSNWREMEVDYRALARRAMLAVVDENHIWAATDTGMILRLWPEAAH